MIRITYRIAVNPHLPRQNLIERALAVATEGRLEDPHALTVLRLARRPDGVSATIVQAPPEESAQGSTWLDLAIDYDELESQPAAGLASFRETFPVIQDALTGYHTLQLEAALSSHVLRQTIDQIPNP